MLHDTEVKFERRIATAAVRHLGAEGAVCAVKHELADVFVVFGAETHRLAAREWWKSLAPLLREVPEQRGDQITAFAVATDALPLSIRALSDNALHGTFAAMWHDRSLVGILGILRRGDSPDYTRDLETVEAQAKYVFAGMLAQLDATAQRCARSARENEADQGSAAILDCTTEPSVLWTNDVRIRELSAEALRGLVQSAALWLGRPDTATASSTGANAMNMLYARELDDPTLQGRKLVAVRVQFRREAGKLRRLSTRESAVAELLLQGYCAVNIAARLGVTEHTVRTYVRRLYTKLVVRNRADFVRTMMTASAEL